MENPAPADLLPFVYVAYGLVSVGLTIWLARTALAASGDAAVQWSLLTGLALLGVVEHLFLVLPLRESALWRWAIPAAPVKEL